MKQMSSRRVRGRVHLKIKHVNHIYLTAPAVQVDHSRYEEILYIFWIFG